MTEIVAWFWDAPWWQVTLVAVVLSWYLAELLGKAFL